MNVLARVFALWFGAGLVPRAPGTAGSLAAIPLYLALRPHGIVAVAVAALAVTTVGVWAAGVVERERAEKDPQVVVIDEVAGMLTTLLAAPPGLMWTLLAFVLFRICDQFKPWPARAAERLPGGWGIVADDLVAGGWAALVLMASRAMAHP